MLSVKVVRSGEDLGLVVGKMRAQLKRRLHGALTASVQDWRRIVISSTWHHPTPSPGSFIIAKWKGAQNGYIFEYGWTHYAGDQGRALYRMGLRVEIFEPRFIDRIDRMVTLSMGGTP